MTQKRYAGGGIVKAIVGAVAKEAPELSRGASTRRAVINIGLDINGGEKLAPEQALGALQRIGVKPVSARIAQSDTEPTLIIELDRSLKADEAHALSAELQQEAIAQVDEFGVGDLHGPAADKWKPFNGDYFIDPSGKRLTQAIMDAGNGEVPGGADPVMQQLDEYLAQLNGQPVKKAGGGLLKQVAEGLIDAATKSEAAVTKPMRLYHGRSFREPIKKLDPFISTNQLGIHLGDAETASKFATIRDYVKPKDAGARVIPLDVDIKNPLRLMDNTGKWEPATVYKQLADGGHVPYDRETESRLHWGSKGYTPDEEGTLLVDDNAPLAAMLEVQDMIRGLGHDGVVYKNRYEFPDEAVQARAEMRDRDQLNTLSDEEFLKEFPESRDSYIAFRNEQLKSPFGDGPGVGFAGGGAVQKFDKGGIARKLGKSIVDFLDFSGSAGKQVRDDVVTNTSLRGDGRKFREFFGDVTSGKSEKYKPSGLDNYDPAIELGPEAAAFREARDGYSGSFDNHIKTSIPGFDETQNAVGSALLKTYGKNGGDILDIGSSEGALIKALSAGSDGRIRTTGIDPNPDMLRTYNEKPQAPGSRSILSAFGSADDAGKVAWEEADGTAIPFFDPQGQRFDAAHEAMVFQFISNARRAQAERMKQLLNDKGIAIFEEKFGGPKNIFDANEAKKDLYKSQYYTPEQMEIKRKEVLNSGSDAVEGMTDLQVSQAEMEEILRGTFKNRAQFWDSGNFKGYAASDDARALEDFLNNLQPLDSAYSTTKTPRGFAEGGGVQYDDPNQDIYDYEALRDEIAAQSADIQSMTHLGAKPRRPVSFETFGTDVGLGDAPYDIADDMSTAAQLTNDAARMGVYGVPVVGPFIGAGLDTAEAVSTDDPLSAGMAVAFGPGGKMVKGAMTGAMAMGMDPAEAEAGVFGRLAKWGQSREGRAAFNDALKMSTKGADNADVFAKTGWFKDVDGHWKFWRSSQGGGIAEPYQGSSLAAVYNDPFLFDQYPHMKNIGHRRKNSNGAHWDEQANEIVVGDTSAPFFQKPEVGGRKGVLDHEIYHAKSTYEGWPQGTSQFGGSVKLGDDIRRLQNIQRTEPGKLVEDDPFWSAIGGIDNYTPLSDLRYRAEMGEALARREASIREFGPDNLRGITPADASLIDMPMNTLFHPGETATMDQYNALIKFLDEKRAQDAALAAKGDVTFGDTEALRVRMGGAPKRKK